MLVSHGANLEAQDYDELCPTYIAAKAGWHVALHPILSAGADLWSATPTRWNALHFAAVGGDTDAVRLLVYWDSDAGVLSRQKNTAETIPAELARCDAQKY